MSTWPNKKPTRPARGSSEHSRSARLSRPGIASNADWQADLATACEKLGGVAVAAEGLDDARVQFRQALAIRETLGNDPRNLLRHRELCVALVNQATLIGSADERNRCVARASAIHEHLRAAGSPDDVQLSQIDDTLKKLAEAGARSSAP